MCGIHGVLSTATAHRSHLSKFIEQGFVVNSLRGMDSSGVFLVDRKKDAWCHKLAIPGPFFVEGKLTRTYVTEAAYSRATVCHVRAATQGKINVDNAHPFVAYRENGRRVIGIHNGTLTSWQSRSGAKGFDVDSEWAINHIADERADAFEDFTGSFAFVWWDSDAPDVVYMARNKDRPLHFVITEDGEDMLFASEPGMLSWLCDRNGIKVKDSEINVLEEGQLYAFDLGGKTISWSKSSLPEAKYPTHSTGSGNYNGSYYGHGGSAYQGARPTNGGGTNNTTAAATTATGTTTAKGGDKGFTPDDIPFKERVPAEAIRPIALFRAALTSSPLAVEDLQEADKSDNNVVQFPKRLSKRERKRLKREQQDRQRAAEAASCSLEGFGSAETVVPEGYFSRDGVDAPEMNAAKSAGLYGQMMYFVPVLYDPDEREMYGEIEDFIPGQGKVRYDAVIRGVTPSQAVREFDPNNARGHHVAVVGRIGEDKSVGGALVVAPLTKEGVEKFAKALS